MVTGDRRYHAVAFDERRGVVVLFGGMGGWPPPYDKDDTWEFDGTTWTQVASGGPPRRMQHAMAFDSRRGVTVMFGGYATYSSWALDDTWEWDGATWTQGPPSGPGRYQHAMAYDSVRGRSVVFGGYPLYDDTWEYDGTAWTPGPASPQGLLAHYDHGMAFDAARGVTVMFGGYTPVGDANQTWEYDGMTWRLGATAPPGLRPRSAVALCYDSTRRRVQSFGGLERNPLHTLDELWEYDGGGWQLALPMGTIPRHRDHAAMAYDSVRGTTVMVGGGANGFTDSWTFRGDPTIAPPTLPAAVVGSPYSAQLQTLGGQPPFAYALAGGALPAGLTLSPGGGIAGTPSQMGTAWFKVRSTDAVGCAGDKVYAISTACAGAPIEVGPLAIPIAYAGRPYAVTFSAQGGTPPFTFAVAAGTLPPGLALSPAGTLSGTPTTAGTAAFDVAAIDTLECSGQRTYTLRVDAAPPRVDFVVGAGPGPANPDRIRLFDRDGISTVVDFVAYGTAAWGANVAGGEIDVDGRAEIVTGPGGGSSLAPHVRGFEHDGYPMAKVSFYAYGTLRDGVNVAVDSVDADAYAELLTAPGPGAPFGPHVRGFDYDAVAVRAISRLSFFAYGSLHWGANAGAADVEADGIDEILTGPGPSPTFAAQLRGFDFDGVAVAPMPSINLVCFAGGYGVVVAGGDVDGDGHDEIVAAPGPGPSQRARFLGFDHDGLSISALPGFDITPTPTLFGGRMALGDLASGVAPIAELATAAGPDPAAASTVAAFGYAGAMLTPLPPRFTPFPAGYGANVAVAAMGY